MKSIKKLIIKQAISLALISAYKKIHTIPDHCTDFSVIIDFKLLTSLLGCSFALHWQNSPDKKNQFKQILIKHFKKSIKDADTFKEFLRESLPYRYEMRISCFKYGGKIDNYMIDHLYKVMQEIGF